MFQRIIEIIIYVITELRSKKPFDEIDLERLKNLGYTNSEISTAFSWLADNGQFGDLLDSNAKVSTDNKYFRILHPAEEEFFTEKARKELIHYIMLGLINNEEIEQLLDRNLLHGFSRIDSDELKGFIANAVFDAYHQNSATHRIILTGNETIN